MARLSYSAQISYGDSLATRFINLSVVASTVTGTPKARIYKDGTSAPAFSNMTLAGSNYTLQAPNLDDAIYIIEYQDTNGTKQFGKFAVRDPDNTCFPASGGLDPVFIVLETGIRFLSFTSIPFSVSIDGGATFKTYIPSNPTGVEWSNSELAAIGYENEIPSLITKRTSNSCLDTVATELFVQTPTYPALVASASKTNVTATGASDGTITVTITDGSGQYQITWYDSSTTNLTSGSNPQSSTKTGLGPGTYVIQSVLDLLSGDEITNISVTITEPQVIPPPPPPPEGETGLILEVPMLNSIQFVVPETIDGCSVFQTLDNTLFKDQYFPGFARTNYFQPFCKCDSPIIQFNSNFSTNTVQLFKCEDNTLIKTILVTLKEQNIGVVEDFNISIKTHPGFSTQSRVYFSGGVIPIPLFTGESLQVLNNSDGFDGVYTIIDILTDTITGSQYLVINLTYDASGPSSAATGRFDVSTDDFNVFEAVCSLVDVDNGIYYIKITSYDVTEGDGLYAISEPMDVQVDHPSTNLLEYSNVDNAFDMTWTTGYIGRIRVPSILAKRLPGGETTTSRDADYSLVTTSGKFIRGVLFETFLLPPYMHEKLSVIFKLDYKAINKVQYNTLEGYGEPQYINQVLLSNSSIKLEQVKVFRKYNSDDIGSVSDGGFILTDSGFIKR